MAGGVGQRFWPLSTSEHPKQFLDLENTGRTLLQATFDRLKPLTNNGSNIFIVTGQCYEELIKEQLPELPTENILLEPVGRDTAPAIALTALILQERFGNVLMGLFTADHRVGNVPAFQQTVKEVISLTEIEQGLTTIGIKPNYPATGFGYIKAGNELVGEGFSGYQVAEFVEKPNQQLAKEYLKSGNYFWNNGIFLWYTDTILQEMEKYVPTLIDTLEKAVTQGNIAETFPQLEKISIDYAVLEKTDKAYVVPADYDWDDLGDWLALERLHKIDQPNSLNTVVGEHINLDSENNIIYNAHSEDVIITLGVKDLVVVKHDNTVLLIHKNRVQDIKQLLKDERLIALEQSKS